MDHTFLPLLYLCEILILLCLVGGNGTSFYTSCGTNNSVHVCAAMENDGEDIRDQNVTSVCTNISQLPNLKMLCNHNKFPLGNNDNSR